MLAALEASGDEHWPVVTEKLEDDGWVKALRYCPTPLLELVNSRACRGQVYPSLKVFSIHCWYTGAVMFNDPLSQSQCEHLIQRLSETVFPFQCAHGRFV